MPFTIAAIVILAALVAVSVASIIKRASQGCCGAGGSKEERVEKDGSAYPYAYKIEIGGMVCKNCAVRIENAFNRQDGLAASVDLKSACAIVRAEKPISEIMLRKTVCDNGYSVGEIVEL